MRNAIPPMAADLYGSCLSRRVLRYALPDCHAYALWENRAEGGRELGFEATITFDVR